MAQACPQCGRATDDVVVRCVCGFPPESAFVIRPGFALAVFGTLAVPFLVGACVVLARLVEQPSPEALGNFVGLLGPGALLAFLALRGLVEGRKNALAGLTTRFWGIAFSAFASATIFSMIHSPAVVISVDRDDGRLWDGGPASSQVHDALARLTRPARARAADRYNCKGDER